MGWEFELRVEEAKSHLRCEQLHSQKLHFGKKRKVIFLLHFKGNIVYQSAVAKKLSSNFKSQLCHKLVRCPQISHSQFQLSSCNIDMMTRNTGCKVSIKVLPVKCFTNFQGMQLEFVPYPTLGFWFCFKQCPGTKKACIPMKKRKQKIELLLHF